MARRDLGGLPDRPWRPKMADLSPTSKCTRAWPSERPRVPIAKMGSVATRGAGLRGPSAPDGGGAETRTEPACGLRDLAGRQRRQVREPGEERPRRPLGQAVAA
ncbi:hypothetical protein NDU88_002706 [Pleurodeles waltl]|uniref:Uncharacterized protein n=1 Tax=Pleurodeles waltl TaxID=8319 RepID=A0AAV7SFQ1_PLEWA|nr:hypothetical protein NDU88_002706 [Pleurodeles waltl]